MGNTLKSTFNHGIHETIQERRDRLGKKFYWSVEHFPLNPLLKGKTLWQIIKKHRKRLKNTYRTRQDLEFFQWEFINRVEKLDKETIQAPEETNGCHVVQHLLHYKCFSTLQMMLGFLPQNSPAHIFSTKEGFDFAPTVISMNKYSTMNHGWHFIHYLIMHKQWESIRIGIERHGESIPLANVENGVSCSSTILTQIIEAKRFDIAIKMAETGKDLSVGFSDYITDTMSKLFYVVMKNGSPVTLCQWGYLVMDESGPNEKEMQDVFKLLRILMEKYTDETRRSMKHRIHNTLTSIMIPKLQPIRQEILDFIGKEEVGKELYKVPADYNRSTVFESLITTSDEQLILDLLNDYPPPIDSLWWRACYDDNEYENRADKKITITEMTKYTPLMLVIKYRMHKVAKYIIDTYKDRYYPRLMFKNKEGFSAKIYSSMKNMFTIHSKIEEIEKAHIV